MEPTGPRPEKLNELSIRLREIEEEEINKELEDIQNRIAKCQLAWIEALQSKNTKVIENGRRTFEANLDQVKESALDNFRAYFGPKDMYKGKVTLFGQLVDDLIQRAQNEITESTDLNKKTKELKATIEKTDYFFKSVFRYFEKRNHASEIDILAQKKKELLPKAQVIDLYSACTLGNLTFIEELLATYWLESSIKRDLNQPDANGHTPIELAAIAGHLHLVEFLMKHGAEAPPIVRDQNHLIHWAAKAGHTEIVAKFPDLIDAEGQCRRTPLHYSSYNGRKETTDFLLNKHAKINVQGNDENLFQTPLHCALERNHQEIIKLLLSYEALNVNKTDRDGKTALDLAAEREFLDIAKLIISHKSWSCPSLQKRDIKEIKFICRAILELNKTHEVLQVYKQQLKDLRAFPTPQNLQIIELYCQTIQDLIKGQTDLKLLLEAWHILYPEQIEIVHNLAERVCFMKSNDPRDRSTVVSLLEVALFMHKPLIQTLQERKVEINLTVLACSMAMEFEENFGKDLRKLIQEYLQGDILPFSPLLKLVKSKVNRGIDKVFYIDETKETSEEKRAPAIDLSSSPINKQPSFASPSQFKPSFPVDALQILLQFSADASFIDMLNRASQKDVKPSLLYSWLGHHFVAPSGSSVNMNLFLGANLTFSQCFSVLRLGLSKLSYENLFQLLAKAMAGEDIKKADQKIHGKWAPVLSAIQKFQEYFKAFYEAKGVEHQLDQQELTIELLKDSALYQLLADQETVTKISNLLVAFNIPGFDQAVAEKALRAFREIQSLVLTEKDLESIKTWNDLIYRLALNPKALNQFLTTSALPLFDDLKHIIGYYLQPKVSPMEILTLPMVNDLLKKKELQDFSNRASFPANANKTFHDRKKLFENYSTQEMGPLLITPQESYIKSKNLTKCFFTHGPVKNEEERSLDCSFDDSAFEDFTFTETQFRNFAFNHLFFKNCNFSAAQFFGEIAFEETYMDATTAQTFLSTLSSCVERGLCTIRGTIILVTVKNAPNLETSISPYLKEHVDKTWVSWGSVEEDNYEPLFEDDVFMDAEEMPELTSPNISPQTQQKRSFTGYMNNLLGGIGNYLGSDSDSLKSLWAIDNSASFSEEMRLELDNLKAELKKVTDIKGLSKQEEERLKLTLNYLDGTQQDIKMELKELRPLFDKLMSKDIKKAQIKAEQFYILHPSRAPLAHFYQSFQSDLSSILQAIFLLQNPLRMLDPVLGRASNLTSRQRSGMLVSMTEKNPATMSALAGWLQKVMRFKDDASIYLEKGRHLAGFIPYAGAAVKAGVEGAIYANDSSKLANSRESMLRENSQSLEKISEKIARAVALAYEDQVLLLSKEGALAFAECGVLRVVAALLQGQIQDLELFAEEAIFAMRALELQQNATILGVEIPWTQRALEMKDKKAESCTGDQLFRLCGVAKQSSKSMNWSYFSNDPSVKAKGVKEVRLPDAPVTNARVFGYMKVTSEQWEKYASRVPDLASDETRLYADFGASSSSAVSTTSSMGSKQKTPPTTVAPKDPAVERKEHSFEFSGYKFDRIHALSLQAEENTKELEQQRKKISELEIELKKK